METNNKIATRVIVGLFFLLAACTSEEGPVFTEIEIPDVSFSTDIQPIFNERCIVCHNETHSTGLDLQEGASHNLLVNVTTAGYAPNVRIAPGSTENSVLWHKIIDDGTFGGQMPAIGPLLSNFQMEKIEAWIEQGALDN